MTHARRPTSVAAALILILLVLTCGCEYVPNHDVIVIGLNPDGTQAWSRTLDTGFDDVAGDIAEMPGGDLVIAAANGSRPYETSVPKIVRLAADGTPLTEHPCPVLDGGDLTSVLVSPEGNISITTYNGKVGWFDKSDILISVTETDMNHVWAQAPAPDGGIVVAGSSMQGYPAGTVPVYDANGTLTTRAPVPHENVETPGCRETILESGDRKIPVTECIAPLFLASQAVLMHLNRSGAVSWQQGYGAYGLESFWSIAASEDGSGYYLAAYDWRGGANTSHRFAVHVHGDGSPDWIRDLGVAALFYPFSWDVREGTVRAILPTELRTADGSYTIQPQIVTFDTSREVTGRQNISASRIIIPTTDGGYFSAGIKEGTDGYTDASYSRYSSKELHALKFHADGSVAWDRVVGDDTADTVIRVIQTADGGYVILAQRSNY